MFNIDEYRQIRKDHFGETFQEATAGYKKYKTHCLRHNFWDFIEEHMNYYYKDIPTTINVPISGAAGFGCVNIPVTPITDPSHTHSFAVKNCPPANANPWTNPEGLWPVATKKQEEDNLMNYASASITAPATEIQDQRKYLQGRLTDIYSAKRNPLEETFGLIDDDCPRTPKELAERIAAGKFIIRGHGDDKTDTKYYHWTDMFQWRDPAKKADRDGFEAAKADLKAKRQAALDTIKIDEPKAGLDAVKALESWEPTGAAN